MGDEQKESINKNWRVWHTGVFRETSPTARSVPGLEFYVNISILLLFINLLNNQSNLPIPIPHSLLWEFMDLTK